MSRWFILPLAMLASGCEDAVRGEVLGSTDASVMDQFGEIDAGSEQAQGSDAADAVVPEIGSDRSVDGTGDDVATDHPLDAAEAEQISTISGEIAVDETYVYTFRNQDLVRIPKGGGAEYVVSSVGGAAYPFAIDSTHAYFFDQLTIHKVAKTGGAWVDMAPQGGATGHVGIALDDARVFFVSINERIFEMPKGATGGTVVYDPDTYDFPTLIASGSDALYWAEFDSMADTYSVVRHVWQGGTHTTIGAGNEVFALTARGSRACWIDRQMSVSTSVDGTQSQPLVTSDIGGDAMDLPIVAVDDVHVYWASKTRGSVFRVALQGGELETVAIGYDFPMETSSTTENTIWKQRQRLATDEAHVYFSDTTGIYRKAK